MFLVKFEKGKYLHGSVTDDYVTQKKAQRFEDVYEAWQAAIDARDASYGSESPRVIKLKKNSL